MLRDDEHRAESRMEAAPVTKALPEIEMVDPRDAELRRNIFESDLRLPDTDKDELKIVAEWTEKVEEAID
jgi:hypothetical protein